MNGRIYDPRLGRMLSPDPVIQAPQNGQNYNRYTYAYNNPLKYSDPSGFSSISFNCGIGSDGVGCAPTIDFGSIFGAFGGNGCDRTCKLRKAAITWCRTNAVCYEYAQTVREHWRKRAVVPIFLAEMAGDNWDIVNGQVVIYDPLPQNDSIRDAKQKALENFSFCGPDQCFIYGTEKVGRPTNNTRIDWQSVPENAWTDVPILGGNLISKALDELGYGIEMGTQTGYQQSQYQVGIHYYYTIVENGVIVAERVTIDTEWIDEYYWVDDEGVESFESMVYRFCILTPGFEKECVSSGK